MKRKRIHEAKHIVPTQYAAEAFGQMSNERKVIYWTTNVHFL